MTGAGAHPCRACGQHATHPQATRLLVTDGDPNRPVLDVAHIRAYRWRPPLHLRNIAGSMPSESTFRRTLHRLGVEAFDDLAGSGRQAHRTRAG